MVGEYSSADDNWRVGHTHRYNTQETAYFRHGQPYQQHNTYQQHNYQQNSNHHYSNQQYNYQKKNYQPHRNHNYSYQQTSRRTDDSSVPYFGPWPDRRCINPLTIPLAPMWAWDQSGRTAWRVSESLAEISKFDETKIYDSDWSIDDGQRHTRSPLGHLRPANRRKDKKSLRKRPDEVVGLNPKDCSEPLRDDEEVPRLHYGEGDLDSTKNQERDTKPQVNVKPVQDNELTANKVPDNVLIPDIVISHENEREVI